MLHMLSPLQLAIARERAREAAMRALDAVRRGVPIEAPPVADQNIDAAGGIEVATRKGERFNVEVSNVDSPSPRGRMEGADDA